MIFIIGPNSSVSRAIGRLLQVSGYNHQSFATAEEFVESCSATKNDCFLIDVDLCGEDNVRSIELLNRPESLTPMVFLTDHNDHAMRDRVRQFDAAAYFSKPVDGQALIDALSFIVD